MDHFSFVTCLLLAIHFISFPCILFRNEDPSCTCCKQSAFQPGRRFAEMQCKKASESPGPTGRGVTSWALDHEQLPVTGPPPSCWPKETLCRLQQITHRTCCSSLAPSVTNSAKFKGSRANSRSIEPSLRVHLQSLRQRSHSYRGRVKKY